MSTNLIFRNSSETPVHTWDDHISQGNFPLTWVVSTTWKEKSFYWEMTYKVDAMGLSRYNSTMSPNTNMLCSRVRVSLFCFLLEFSELNSQNSIIKALRIYWSKENKGFLPHYTRSNGNIYLLCEGHLVPSSLPTMWITEVVHLFCDGSSKLEYPQRWSLAISPIEVYCQIKIKIKRFRDWDLVRRGEERKMTTADSERKKQPKFCERNTMVRWNSDIVLCFLLWLLWLFFIYDDINTIRETVLSIYLAYQLQYCWQLVKSTL